MKERD
jgi:superfamily II DNA helicase RecQ